MRTAIISTYPPRVCGLGTFAAAGRATLLGVAGIERAEMGRRVDAKSEARHDRQARVTERACEAFRIALTLRSCIPAADDGQRRSCEQVETPVRVEQRRRIRNLKKQLRISLVGEGNDGMVRLRGPLACRGDRGCNFGGIEGLNSGPRNVSRQFGAGEGQHFLWQPVLLEQLSNGGGAEAWCKGEFKPTCQPRVRPNSRGN